jgi:hypothetical protein
MNETLSLNGLNEKSPGRYWRSPSLESDGIKV